MRSENKTNKDNRYHLHVVGDSPELCRGLDSHGFADLKAMLNFCVALTSQYKIDDPERFHMGTPAHVASSLSRAWEAAPTSSRICDDIKSFPCVLQCIVDAKGCVVPDEALRSGRRYFKLKGDKGESKHKPRARQRVANSSPPSNSSSLCKGFGNFKSCGRWSYGQRCPTSGCSRSTSCVINMIKPTL
jgi:hypothetical protein